MEQCLSSLVLFSDSQLLIDSRGCLYVSYPNNDALF